MSDGSSAASRGDTPGGPVPDWSAVTREVHCPLCEYNLRGLVEPRCPECGCSFQWAEIFNPSLQVHPYLIEHHPRRPVRSGWLTLRGGLRPQRFWTQLKPVHTVYPRRILGYWVLMILATLAALIATMLILLLARKLADSRLFTSAHPFKPLPFRMRFWSTRIWWRSFVVPLAGMLAALELALPWLTLATLMIFQTSLRRKEIRSVHLLRCVLYSTDALLWANLAMLLTSIAAFVFWEITGEADPNNIFGRYVPSRIFAYFYLPIWGIVCYRLYVGCRRYLQLDHVLATIVASQVIVALSVPAAVVVSFAIKELI